VLVHFQAADGLRLAPTRHLPGNSGGVATGIASLFDASHAHERLIARPRDLQDNAIPSGNGMAATTLLKLAGLTGEHRYVDIANQMLARMQPMMARYPLGFGQWLQALAFAVARPREIAIVGDPVSADTQALLGIVRGGYRPFRVVALGAPGAQLPDVPLLQGRRLVEGRATAYVCRDFACQAPTTEPEGLQAQLERR
jgi:uncharacterized protein YyaL (SSP411 family)